MHGRDSRTWRRRIAHRPAARHIGFQNYVLYDDDAVEESNLNRLVGATAADALAETPKLHLAKMKIYSLQPRATVRGFACKWQEQPEALRECQIVIGCVDSYKGREELEIACRRYLMHYIDIGMDVHGEKRPIIGGQVRRLNVSRSWFPPQSRYRPISDQTARFDASP